MKVYTIKGSTGEYEDFYTWTIPSCFLKKENAINYLITLKNKLSELKANDTMSWQNYIDNSEKIRQEMYKLDSKFHLDYTGVNYDIEELEIKD